MPVAFMSGVIGKFFLQFGVTLSVAVAISYLEAITLAPARCAQMLHGASHASRGVVGRAADRAFEALSRAYARTLDRALRVPWLVIGAGVAVLAIAGWTATQLRQEFVPSQDQSRLSVRLTTTVGATLDETDAYVRRAEKFLEERPEVLNVLSNVSPGGASLYVTMVPPGQRKLTQSDFSNVMRKEFSSYPGLRAAVQDLSQQGFGGSKGFPVQFSVRGSDWNALVALATRMKAETAASGLVTDVDSDYQLGAPELVVTPDRSRATDVGVSISDIANTVSALVGGVVVGQYSNEGRRMDIRARLVAAQRSRPEDLAALDVRASNGALIPLSSVVRMKEQAELQQINHADRERAITITGNVAPGHAQSEALAFVQSLAASAPPGYRVVLGGQSDQFGQAMTSLVFALVIGILVAYMVLASQFNSFLHPVTVLTILPLSVAGAVFALLAAHKTLNVFSMIGLLLLMGIVKKNSIILVDYANEVREKDGLDARQSMLRSGPVRLRPILMTATATLMAAVPSALGLGPGAETRGPMADAVIGGLILSTVLSLLVVPAFYVVADRLRPRPRKRASVLGTATPAGAAEPGLP
jgi:multidrug efflux pump subunit AcrB